VLGSGGINCDPPNPPTRSTPRRADYYRVQISRGCAPAEAYPYALTPQRAQHVDPDTGRSRDHRRPLLAVARLEDGYNAIGTTHFDNLQTTTTRADPCSSSSRTTATTPGAAGTATTWKPRRTSSPPPPRATTPTVVEEYLADHPVPANDIVARRGWRLGQRRWRLRLAADSQLELAARQRVQGQVDIENGWAEDIRNWAVITAAQNRVETAEQITAGDAGRYRRIGYPEPNALPIPPSAPGTTSSGAQLGLHVLRHGRLRGQARRRLQRGAAHAAPSSAMASDDTGPEVWIPSAGPGTRASSTSARQYGYQPRHDGGTDFHIWTFVYDVSGHAESVTLKTAPTTTAQPARRRPTTRRTPAAPRSAVADHPHDPRDFPAGQRLQRPKHRLLRDARRHRRPVLRDDLGLHENVLIDYYVEARDERGNVKRSPIQHVWIDDGSGSSGGDTVLVDPDPVLAGEPVTVTYDPAGRPLDGGPAVHMHYGFDGWVHVVSPDPVMTWDADDEVWRITVDVRSDASQFDVVFRNADGTVWDNNGGADWHFAVEGGEPGDDWTMDGILDGDAIEIATSAGRSIWAGIKDATLYVAVPDAGEGFDHFILLADTPGSMQPAPWAKAGQVAAWDAFLADENDNDYCAWFDADAATQAATGPNGGVLEGTVSLTDLYGVVPDQVALALARYQSPDGGQLDAASQVPASVNGDGNVDAAEYLIVDTDDLIPGTPGDLDGDGDVDLADLGILLASFEVDDGGDLDGDGDTDLSDLGILLANFGA
jgi:hypothetical protein